jgi:hypothetical protein
MWLGLRKLEEKWEAQRLKKTRRCMFNGVPDSDRGKVWFKFLCPGGKIDLPQRLVPLDCWKDIENDLYRTMPRVMEFHNEAKIASLRRVLRALSNYNRELNYVQGMSSVAAHLLLYMTEDRAFSCLVKLMADPAFHFRIAFQVTPNSYKQVYSLWEWVLKKKFPDVSNHFQKVNVNSYEYGSNWFVTSFLNSHLPNFLRLLVFDRILAFGFRAVLSFALVVIAVLKVKLLTLDYNGILELLRDFDNEKIDCEQWVSKYNELWIADKVYARARTETKVPL